MPRIPRHARAVLIGDFLAPLEETRRVVAQLAAGAVRGHLLQVLDPAEETLPFTGRVRFHGPWRRRGGAGAARRGRCGRCMRNAWPGIGRGWPRWPPASGWSFATHRTDQPPETALLALHRRLAPG